MLPVWVLGRAKPQIVGEVLAARLVEVGREVETVFTMLLVLVVPFSWLLANDPFPVPP